MNQDFQPQWCSANYLSEMDDTQLKLDQRRLLEVNTLVPTSYRMTGLDDESSISDAKPKGPKLSYRGERLSIFLEPKDQKSVRVSCSNLLVKEIKDYQQPERNCQSENNCCIDDKFQGLQKSAVGEKFKMSKPLAPNCGDYACSTMVDLKGEIVRTETEHFDTCSLIEELERILDEDKEEEIIAGNKLHKLTSILKNGIAKQQTPKTKMKNNPSWAKFLPLGTSDLEEREAIQTEQNITNNSKSQSKPITTERFTKHAIDTNIDLEELLDKHPEFTEYYQRKLSKFNKQEFKSKASMIIQAALRMPFAKRINESDLVSDNCLP